jgi:hypothetical protein
VDRFWTGSGEANARSPRQLLADRVSALGSLEVACVDLQDGGEIVAGDRFLTGSDLQEFRVVAASTDDPPAECDGVLVVEAVDGW